MLIWMILVLPPLTMMGILSLIIFVTRTIFPLEFLINPMILLPLAVNKFVYIIPFVVISILRNIALLLHGHENHVPTSTIITDLYLWFRPSFWITICTTMMMILLPVFHMSCIIPHLLFPLCQQVNYCHLNMIWLCRMISMGSFALMLLMILTPN